MAKQTAVEWLQELYNSRPDWEQFILIEEFEQAKQMEKQQIAEAYRVGVEEDVYHSPLTTGEEYYKRTYEK
jgi:hypothetical protein